MKTKTIWTAVGGAVAMVALWLVTAAAPDPTQGHFPAITIGGLTNVYTDLGTQLLRNGVPVGGGGSTIWTNSANAFFQLVPSPTFTAFYPPGGLYIGTNAFDWWGSTTGGFVSVKDQAAGEGSGNDFAVEWVDDAGVGFTKDIGHEALVTDTDVTVNTWMEDDNTGLPTRWIRTHVEMVDPYFDLKDAGFPTGQGGAWAFHPYINGDNYYLGTSNVTAGVIFRLKNSATNEFTVDFDGAMAAGGTDKWKLGGETVPGGTTNLVVTVNGQKYRFVAVPIP